MITPTTVAVVLDGDEPLHDTQPSRWASAAQRAFFAGGAEPSAPALGAELVYEYVQLAVPLAGDALNDHKTCLMTEKALATLLACGMIVSSLTRAEERDLSAMNVVAAARTSDREVLDSHVGPTTLPGPVIERIRHDFMDFQGTGMARLSGMQHVAAR
jgi:hypothetical protein